MTADAYMTSGGPTDPGIWNRYRYADGDPTNGSDPLAGVLQKMNYMAAVAKAFRESLAENPHPNPMAE